MSASAASTSTSGERSCSAASSSRALSSVRGSFTVARVAIVNKRLTIRPVRTAGRTAPKTPLEALVPGVQRLVHKLVGASVVGPWDTPDAPAVEAAERRDRLCVERLHGRV